MKKCFIIVLLAVVSSILFAGEPAILPDVFNPGRLTTHDKYIYIVEGYTVKIYSAADFKFIKEFGGKGEGPGEFRFPLRNIDFDDNNIYIANLMSVHIFSHLGEFIKSKRTQNVKLHVIPLKDNFVTCEMSLSAGPNNHEFNLNDSGFKKIKEIYKVSTPPKEFYMLDTICWFGRSKEKIIVADAGKDLILIFNETGAETYRFNLKNEKIPIPDGFKRKKIEKLKRGFKQNWEVFRKRTKLIWPEYFQVIDKIVTSHGKLFVKTFKNQNGKSEFIILDLEGKILKTVFLPDAKLFSINKDKYYYLRENAKEQWELHVEDI